MVVALTPARTRNMRGCWLPEKTNGNVLRESSQRLSHSGRQLTNSDSRSKYICLDSRSGVISGWTGAEVLLQENMWSFMTPGATSRSSM